jgi:CheY-like chemotaxis protein
VHTLLLADESVTIQRVMQLIFADQDVRVVAVGDGDQAIQRLDAAPPDIVLADTSIPGTNGYEVARYVKQSPRLAHIPVVLLTGAFEPVDHIRATEAGCDGVLAKPFEAQLVISRVRQLLTASQSAPAAADENMAGPSETPSLSPPQAPRETAAAVDVAVKADELDEYFDRLGKAFAERLSAATESAREPVAQPEASDQGTSDVPSDSATDWQDSPPSPGPVSTDSDRGPATQPAPAFDTAPTPETPAAAPATDRSAPAVLAEKFAALLAAEPDTLPIDPAAAGHGPAIDEIVEQVSRRVLTQLSERVVRETVTDLVADVAERLVREEIERIKASIK